MTLNKNGWRILSFLFLSLLLVNASSVFYPELGGAPSANAQDELGSQVAVLVDKSATPYYDYYVGGVWKWLEWWKMNFEEIDVSSVTVTHSLLINYNVILIPQFKLAENGHLDSQELQAISQAVYEDGIGLVQADAYLQSYISIWSDYNKLFNVTVNNWISATSSKLNLMIVNNTHFITEIYRNGTKMNRLFPNEGSGEDLWKESDLVFENVTVGSEATTLAVMSHAGKDYLAIIAKTHGNGRVVLSTFSTGRASLGKGGYDGFGERANFKTTSGMNGLLWKSLTWTAKKPFVFMGMPPFLNFRVDDVSIRELEGYDTSVYIGKLLEYGFFVNLYIFQDDTRDAGTSYQNLLKNYYMNGSTHIAPHAWSDDENVQLIYWNYSSNMEYSNSTLSAYFNQLDADYAAWNITASAFIVSHMSMIGENAVPFLKERGWVFISCVNRIPYSAGDMRNCWIWDADWKRLAHLDYADDNNIIFNVAVEMPVGVASYDYPDCLLGADSPPNPAKATRQILCCLEHGLADLFWGDAYTHEQSAVEFSASNWDRILSWVFGNVTTQYPFVIKASKEYIARYAQNRGELSISNYDYTGNSLTLDLSGTSTLPVALYLFTDQKISSYSGMMDYFRSYGDDGYMIWIPPYQNGHQVAITFADEETSLPHIHFTSANVTSTHSSMAQLVIDAKPVWKHDKPLYPFEINCTDLGQPRSVTINGTSVDFVYDSQSKIASFNVTFSSDGRIVVGWGEFELHLEAGWNMVSFPVIPSDPSFSNIFNGVGYYQVLTWDGTSYAAPSAAEAGRGYWILVLSAITVNLVGEAVESYEADLPGGWSMIGSIHENTVDAETVFPRYYQLLIWDGSSYVVSTSIEPGKGYWALVLEPTHILVDKSL